jgi:hypothetical protein
MGMSITLERFWAAAVKKCGSRWWIEREDWDRERRAYQLVADVSCDKWHTVFKSTMHHVEVLRRRVRVGHQVDDCQAFARYISRSGVLELMEEFCEPSDVLRSLFPFSAKELRKNVDALEQECYAYYRGRTKDADGTASGADKSDLEAIDEKLNLIGGLLANVVSARRRISHKPRLRLLPSDTGTDALRLLP